VSSNKLKFQLTEAVVEVKMVKRKIKVEFNLLFQGSLRKPKRVKNKLMTLEVAEI
jgi:hypothetical protein